MDKSSKSGRVEPDFTPDMVDSGAKEVQEVKDEVARLRACSTSGAFPAPNRYGISAIHGQAVESGGITAENMDEFIESLGPVLELSNRAWKHKPKESGYRSWFAKPFALLKRVCRFESCCFRQGWIWKKT